MELAYFIIDRNANFPDIPDCVNHTCANGGLCEDGIGGFHAISEDTNNNGEMNKCWWANKAS